MKEVDSDEDDVKWNGIVGDLVSGAAHMSFAALSVSSARSEVIDFSSPYFFSGVSFLAAPQQKSEIPLMAFLLPFSPELWIAIFTSNLALYELFYIFISRPNCHFSIKGKRAKFIADTDPSRKKNTIKSSKWTGL